MKSPQQDRASSKLIIQLCLGGQLTQCAVCVDIVEVKDEHKKPLCIERAQIPNAKHHLAKILWLISLSSLQLLSFRPHLSPAAQIHLYHTL
jgi:hypothetical protein